MHINIGWWFEDSLIWDEYEMLVNAMQGFQKSSWCLLSHVNLCCIPSEFRIILQFWEWVWKRGVLCCRYFLRERQLCWSSWTLFYQCSPWGRGRTESPESESQRHADASRKEVLVAQVVMQCCHQTGKKTQTNRFSPPENRFLRLLWKGGGMSDSQNWKERSRNFESFLLVAGVFCFLFPYISS